LILDVVFIVFNITNVVKKPMWT